MSQVRPRIALRSGRAQQPVRIPIEPLIVDPLAESFLVADSAASSSALTVKDTTGFATTQVLGIGNPGTEGSEIKTTHTSTAVTSSTITLGVSTVFPHSSGSPIKRLLYDQVILYTDPNPVSTAPTTLTTLGLVYDSPETSYNDTATTSGFYFARYQNSLNGLFSSLSDAAPVGGYTRLMARSLIDSALDMINKKTSDVLTDEFGFREIDNCQIETIRELKRWSWMQSFDTIVATARDGNWSFAVPTDLDDQNTQKSIYGVRVGTDRNLTWIDKQKWEDITEGISYTTLNSNVLLGASTIVLTNSGNFDDAGTVTVAQSGSMLGATQYSFTSNTRSTNTLGIDGTAASLGVIGASVFQGASQGMPQYWTTFGGKVYHYPLIDSTRDYKSYSMDYYKLLTPITSDYSSTVLPDPTVIHYYLAWKFLLKLANGEESNASKSMFDNYIVRREKLKQKETVGTTFVLKPRYNNWARQMRGSRNGDDRATRTGNFPNT